MEEKFIEIISEHPVLTAVSFVIIILLVLPLIFGKRKKSKMDETKTWEIEDLPKLNKFKVLDLHHSSYSGTFRALLFFKELPKEFEEKFGDNMPWVNFIQRSFEKLEVGEIYIIKGNEPVWVADDDSTTEVSTLSVSA